MGSLSHLDEPRRSKKPHPEKTCRTSIILLDLVWLIGQVPTTDELPDHTGTLALSCRYGMRYTFLENLAAYGDIWTKKRSIPDWHIGMDPTGATGSNHQAEYPTALSVSWMKQAANIGRDHARALQTLRAPPSVAGLPSGSPVSLDSAGWRCPIESPDQLDRCLCSNPSSMDCSDCRV